MINIIRKVILQTRQDTLRQVLPMYDAGPFDYDEYLGGMSVGHNDCIEKIEQKAKEIWGIDFNKD
jgi:hypothetical protein